ncbi:hypothetical protein AYP92_08080 [Lactobacillus crispatus]|uniref:hypothetical protein n=1 Tax=Lactobacillus TaxID=1578 RepID=UPI000B5DA7EA|nr:MULTISPECIES: hypothetical protein [Lactobacillus]OXC23207.1 hypothetical protein AYP83_01270 [Lactobacillus crispatus]OXC42709.1 hypothetical protein AYP92_08080 [Lactobacillus crispatus]PEH12456.1 hypothetical protein CP352_03180 [Lactobacillus sp. UMNPBX1]
MAYETTDQLIDLLSHHWYKRHDGNLYKLLDIYNSNLEQISDSGEKVAEWRAIKNAEGTTLDLFGKDIETYRPTKDDPPYRFLIYLKTLLARAQGTRPSIVKITSAAIGTDQGLKIWNTGIPRHVGIQIPWDYVSQWPIEKFLLKNLQHMLDLGYWLDVIVFKTTTHLPLYIAAGGQDRTHIITRTQLKWWTGWKTKNDAKLYVGMHTSYKDVWREHQKLKWWTGWKTKNDSNLYIAVTGRIIKTSVWHAKTKWWTSTEAQLHAGLTIGNKTITQTTQSIRTE